MLVILEGPDGSGKSTLAQELAEYLGRTTSDKIEVWHAKRPERHPLNEYLRPLRTYRPGTGHHLILDRWHWGEAVYPAVLDRETELDSPVWWAIEAYLRRLGALVVECDRYATQEYVDLYRERGLDDTPDSWQLTHLGRIRDEFHRTVYRSQLPSLTYCPGDDKVAAIVAEARELETNYRVLSEFTTYLGPLRPEVLLLGDERNIVPRADPENPDPAFVPFRGTSGYYLLRALTSLTSRQWRHSIGLANACDVDDPVELRRKLGEPPVVALGKNAYGKMMTSGFTDVGVVPHPQFVRRFHHRKHVEYGWLIHTASRTREDLSKWLPSSTETPDVTSTSTS